MLPILLFNNMEGSSNSLNNNPSSSFSGIYDENVILNCVRSRKKVSELPNCPVCSCTIRQGELDSHLCLELEKLNKISFAGSKRKLSVNSSPMAIPGSSTTSHNDGDDQDIDVSGCTGSDVYSRVHNNRLQRLRARRRSTPPATQPTDGECPVCGCRRPVSRLQRHALRCLRRTGAGAPPDDLPLDSSSEDGSIDVENDEPSEESAGGSFGAEYSWCGQWRVRAAALQRPQARPAPRRASSDAALVVDGDEDTELYGPPQYSPSRIALDAEIGNDVEDPPEQRQESEEPPQSEGGEGGSSQENMEEVGKSKGNGLVAASAETRILALKAKIKELETKQNSAAEAKCLICLGPYVSPAVSIQCWHVYCEVCWLQSLKAKKICPHCSAITTAQHLRRIYM